MSQPCAATKCSRTSRGLCDCCQQQLCIQHLSEHNASLMAQLNPLTDEINSLGDRLKTLNLQKIAGNGYQKLEQWRADCYRKIDQFFEQKRQELDRLVEQKVKTQREDLNEVQSKVAAIIREEETTRQDIDSLTLTIRRLKEQMNKTEERSFTITTHPLRIDDTFVVIKERTEDELDQSTLPLINKTVDTTVGCKLAIACNDKTLLMHRNLSLHFVDQEMNVVKEVLWNDDDVITDMCWSSRLDRFIVIGKKKVFIVDENTLTIEKVQTIEERIWLSCTCSKDFLFLSTDTFGSSIMTYSLLSSIKLITTWKSPHTCAKDEIIYSMAYSNETLGMLIKNKTEKSLRMELRSADTLNCIWSLRFDTVCNQNILFSCCSLTCDEWLVLDYETKRLLQVTKDGRLKTTVPYDKTPHYARIFANRLIISATNGINCHKL